ncbi:MAG: hypothetical protein WCD89_03610 [Anaerocolumna sp.]
MTNNSEHPIAVLKIRYPQIMLPIGPGMSKSEIYKSAVKSGKSIPADYIDNSFSYSEADFLINEKFSCGEIDILYLSEREDFEKFIQKTVYKCEPKNIPLSMGAITINGLNNWDKINHYLTGNHTYLNAIGAWNSNYAKFLSNGKNYKDSIIVLSNGYYSGLDYKYTKYSRTEWIEKSFLIRKYHELTHFICQRKYPELKNPLLDEVTADGMGLIMAVGKYDTRLAKYFLGIEKNIYHRGMRLENYLNKGDETEKLAGKVRELINQLEAIMNELYRNIDKNDFEAWIDTLYPMAADLYSKVDS